MSKSPTAKKNSWKGTIIFIQEVIERPLKKGKWKIPLLYIWISDSQIHLLCAAIFLLMWTQREPRPQGKLYSSQIFFLTRGLVNQEEPAQCFSRSLWMESLLLSWTTSHILKKSRKNSIHLPVLDISGSPLAQGLYIFYLFFFFLYFFIIFFILKKRV